jgi:hypothetical protein
LIEIVVSWKEQTGFDDKIEKELTEDIIGPGAGTLNADDGAVVGALVPNCTCSGLTFILSDDGVCLFEFGGEIYPFVGLPFSDTVGKLELSILVGSTNLGDFVGNGSPFVVFCCWGFFNGIMLG